MNKQHKAGLIEWTTNIGVGGIRFLIDDSITDNYMTFNRHSPQRADGWFKILSDKSFIKIVWENYDIIDR